MIMTKKEFLHMCLIERLKSLPKEEAIQLIDSELKKECDLTEEQVHLLKQMVERNTQ